MALPAISSIGDIQPDLLADHRQHSHIQCGIARWLGHVAPRCCAGHEGALATVEEHVAPLGLVEATFQRAGSQPAGRTLRGHSTH